MDFIYEILHGDENSNDLQVVAVNTSIGDGVTAVSICPHCGQIHSVYLPESVVADYAMTGFQTVLTLAPSICGCCTAITALDGVTIDNISPPPFGRNGRIFISYSCQCCGTGNENHNDSEVSDNIREIVESCGDPNMDYCVTVHEYCDNCLADAEEESERQEMAAELSIWRANHNPILDGLTYAHGLSAYRGSRSVREIFRSVNDIQSHPEWELCCTDTIYNDQSLVGDYGLYVKGELTGLFNGDCWSEIDSQGNRYATRSNPIDLDDLFDLRADENYSHRQYCEAWVKNVQIVGVWITEKAARRWHDVRDAMQSIANDLGVDLSIVQVRNSYDCRYDDMAVAMGYDY